MEITKKCNYRCTYCFENHCGNEIDICTIDEICLILKEYIKKNSLLKNVVAIWFGGEPTLYIDYIIEANKKIKETCKEINLEYSSRIITNGYYLEKIIPYIKEWNLTDIQVTFDGTKEVHDARRKLINGKGTFDKIIRNIKLIHMDIDLVIRVNVDSSNIKNIYQLYDFFTEMEFDEKVKVYFQPMLVEDYGGESSCYLGKLIQDEKLYEEYVNLLAYTHTLEKPCFIKAFCNVDFPGSLVISNDGYIHKCWAETENSKKALGKLGVSSSEDVVAKMQNAGFSLKYDRCKECEIFPVCLGGCKFMSYSVEDCERRKAMIRKEIICCIQSNI